MSRALVLAAVAFWAACCGDTVRDSPGSFEASTTDYNRAQQFASEVSRSPLRSR